MNVMNEIRLIYKAAVDAVKPGVLISRAVRYSGNVVHIQEDLKLEVNQNCHVIGFGKAVLGMALQIDEILGHHTKNGIISIPHGVVSQYSLSAEFLKKYKIYEGAINNVPDETSLQATKEIQTMISALKESDILFVLISGGGSALLASPLDDLTLDDKQKTIQLLSKSGANIQELNSVRKKLSRVKGGKLAQLSYPATSVALILSDVIGNPLDVIASGPTVVNKDSEDSGMDIIRKYQLESKLPPKVVNCLSISSNNCNDFVFDHVHNYLIGANLTALKAAEAYANQIGFVTVIMSDHIQGDAKEIGQHFARLASVLTQMMTASDDQHKHMEALSVAAENLFMDPRDCCKLERLLRGCYSSRKNFCLIGGGESTVAVRGSGLGGRNQEMVLSYLIEAGSELVSDTLDVIFLSAGTDGIDGPTDAAGAMSHQSQFAEAKLYGLDPLFYLNNNDSYSFFQKFRQGAFHILTGPSGTNVMDVHILCLIWK